MTNHTVTETTIENAADAIYRMYGVAPMRGLVTETVDGVRVYWFDRDMLDLPADVDPAIADEAWGRYFSVRSPWAAADVQVFVNTLSPYERRKMYRRMGLHLISHKNVPFTRRYPVTDDVTFIHHDDGENDTFSVCDPAAFTARKGDTPKVKGKAPMATAKGKALPFITGLISLLGVIALSGLI